MLKNKLKRELSEEIKSVKKIIKCENNNELQRKDRQKKKLPMIGKRKDFMLVKYNKVLNEKNTLQGELKSLKQESNFKIKSFENMLALKENEIHTLTCDITDLKEKLQTFNYARETQATQTESEPENIVPSSITNDLPDHSETVSKEGNDDIVSHGNVDTVTEKDDIDIDIGTEEVDNSELEKTSLNDVVSLADFEKLKEENQLLRSRLLRATIEKMALKRENFQLYHCKKLPCNPFHEMDFQEM